MKKKIAMFATGWGDALILNYGTGIVKAMEDYEADLYLFLCYPTVVDEKSVQMGEMNIFNLPNLSDFDGAVLLGNGLDIGDTFDHLSKRCEEAGIPAVATGRTNDYTYFIGSENYTGSYNLAKHLVFDHGVKNPIFIAGSADNPDSNARLQALKDVLLEAGISLKEENIYYSQWEAKRADDIAFKLLSDGNSTGIDAIVCANDPLAMAACQGVERAGCSVPEDVIVTGFDNDYYAQICSPSISSVDQRFDLLGEHALRTLMKVIDGEECPKVQTFPCQYLPSESCGCTGAKDFDLIRRFHGKKSYRDYMYNLLFTSGVTAFEKTILSGVAYENLKENIEAAHKQLDFFLGDSFQVVLEPLYEKGIFNSERKLRTTGYSRIMDVVFSMDNGNVIYNNNFESRKLLPQDLKTDKNRVHIFVPLHEKESNFGYAVLSDDITRVGNYNHIFTFVSRFSAALAKYKQNLSLSNLNSRLLEITETDSLTHVKNRNSYSIKEKEYNTKIKVSSKTAFGIGMFDVNNLKTVNDELGHEAGDEYIINSCMMICKIFKRSPVYRLGGDEFLVFLQGDDYEDRDRLLEMLRAQIKDLDSQDIPLVEKLSVASGIAIYDPGVDSCVADVLKKADELMYENKVFMKGSKNVR